MDYMTNKTCRIDTKKLSADMSTMMNVKLFVVYYTKR